jgi:hypothetical protein
MEWNLKFCTIVDAQLFHYYNVCGKSPVVKPHYYCKKKNEVKLTENSQVQDFS